MGSKIATGGQSPGGTGLVSSRSCPHNSPQEFPDSVSCMRTCSSKLAVEFFRVWEMVRSVVPAFRERFVAKTYCANLERETRAWQRYGLARGFRSISHTLAQWQKRFKFVPRFPSWSLHNRRAQIRRVHMAILRE